jgi:hypothetical protein
MISFPFHSKKPSKLSSRYSENTVDDIDEDLVNQQEQSIVHHTIDEDLLEYSNSKPDVKISFLLSSKCDTSIMETSAFKTQDVSKNKSGLKLDLSQILNKLVSPIENTDDRLETARFAENNRKSWLKEGLAEFQDSMLVTEQLDVSPI